MNLILKEILIIILAVTPTFQASLSLEEALKDPSVPLIRLHYKAYNNQDPQKNWAKCFFRYNEEKEEFHPCPQQIRSLLTNKLVSPPAQVTANIKGEKFISELILFYARKKVSIWRRSLEGYKSDGEDFPVEADLTLTKELKLESITLAEEYTINKPTWQEQSWIDMSINPEAIHKVNLTQGQFGVYTVTETRSSWPLKEGVSRYDAFKNLLDLEEMRDIGCKCIQSRFKSFIGPPIELMEECRGQLITKREEIKQAVKLSLCLNQQELEEMHQRLKFNDEL